MNTSTKPWRLIHCFNFQWDGWFISSHDMNSKSKNLVWLHTQGRFNKGCCDHRMLLSTQNQALQLLIPGVRRPVLRSSIYSFYVSFNRRSSNFWRFFERSGGVFLPLSLDCFDLIGL